MMNDDENKDLVENIEEINSSVEKEEDDLTTEEIESDGLEEGKALEEEDEFDTEEIESGGLEEGKALEEEDEFDTEEKESDELGEEKALEEEDEFDTEEIESGEVGEEKALEEEDEFDTEEKESDELGEGDTSEEWKKRNIIEGALFVAGRPISIEELNIKTNIKKSELKNLLESLAMDYLMRSTALEIIQIQDKYGLQIKPEYTPNVKKFASGGLIPDRHLKTLTIIALKQPILKSKLVKIRGTGAYEHVKFLIDRGFIDAIKKGRTHELTTTDQFSDTFGLSRDTTTLKKQMITQLGLPENNNEPE